MVSTPAVLKAGISVQRQAHLGGLGSVTSEKKDFRHSGIVSAASVRNIFQVILSM